jgi:cytochrome c oxidase cbb3-type subunit 3/ubiquinol-cytochrome c reductase cytochrome c subunit
VKRFVPIADFRLQIADRTSRGNLQSAVCNLRPWRSLVILAALATGCDLPGRPDPAERPVPANEVLDFSVLYGQNCAGCHGLNGKLGPAPPLNDSLFRAIVPVEELERIVAKGREKALMPAFASEQGGPLTEVQIQLLVKEIKGVRYKIVEKPDGGKTIVEDANGTQPQWGLPAQPPKSAPSYKDPQGSKARLAALGDKQKGAAVFARACAVCHGDDGRGERSGHKAIHDPVFLALISDQVLRRYVITGRPDLNMPNFAEARPDNASFKSLTNQDVTDLVALLASWRQDHATKP